MANRAPIKHAWDAAALGQVLCRGNTSANENISFAQRMNCVKFYFNAAGIDQLLATMTRSGTLWTQLTIHLAIDLANGGDGEYFYDGMFWPRDGFPYRKLDWRLPSGHWEQHLSRTDGGPDFTKPFYFHTHHPYFRVRSAQLKNMKIVVITRSILESLESKYVKYSNDQSNPSVLMDNEDSFPWGKMLNDEIEFYNSWGDVISWHENILHMTYHQMKAEPLVYFQKILKFWDLDVPEWCVEEALKRSSKIEMKKKMSENQVENNLQVSYRGKDKRGVISKVRKKIIIDHIDSKLIHYLGYEYNYGTVYGFEYE